MSTLGSATSSLYEPYAFVEDEQPQSLRNCSAREADVEEAAATTSCATSLASRVEGSIRRSLVKAGGDNGLGIRCGNT